jgi:hypothetical protein
MSVVPAAARGVITPPRGRGRFASGQGSSIVRYFTSFGPRYGELLYSPALAGIGVIEALDKPMSIGAATCVGRDARGGALWTLSVHDDDVPGRWIVIDREFHPAQ